MTRPFTKNIFTMTELCEPQKVLAGADEKRVAVLKEKPRYAIWKDVLASLEKRSAVNQPVLDHLSDN
ncbi:MAG: hypothetical protein P8X50_13185 [Maritimibacter sp.]